MDVFAEFGLSRAGGFDFSDLLAEVFEGFVECDAAVVDDGDVVGDALDVADNVGGDDAGGVMIGCVVAKVVVEGTAGGGVEAVGGLVEKKQVCA